jgi:hypothetical protein
VFVKCKASSTTYVKIRTSNPNMYTDYTHTASLRFTSTRTTTRTLPNSQKLDVVLSLNRTEPPMLTIIIIITITIISLSPSRNPKNFRVHCAQPVLTPMLGQDPNFFSGIRTERPSPLMQRPPHCFGLSIQRLLGDFSLHRCSGKERERPLHSCFSTAMFFSLSIEASQA